MVRLHILTFYNDVFHPSLLWNVHTMSDMSLTPFSTLCIQNCTVLSSRKLSCVIPVLERVPVGTSFQYSLRFDNDILSNLSSLQSLTAVADPVFVGVQPTQYQETSNHTFAVLVSQRIACIMYSSHIIIL